MTDSQNQQDKLAELERDLMLERAQIKEERNKINKEGEAFLREIDKMQNELISYEAALVLAGRMADCAINLVGGSTLNEVIQPVRIDHISSAAHQLRLVVEAYNDCIIQMHGTTKQ
jgi:hypothetical protein